MKTQQLNKLLIIDCQILQTVAFDRGMGKYTMSLLMALGKIKDFYGSYDTVIILNKNLNYEATRVKTIHNLIPGSKIESLDLPVSVTENTNKKYQSAQFELTSKLRPFLIEYQQISYLVTSPFFVEFVATFPDHNNIQKLALVYDIIPYRLWYKQKIFPDDIYLKHFEIFLTADHLLTISHTVADDLRHLLGIDNNKITPIDGGAFSYKPTINYRPTESPYIVFPSAPIVHKNNATAVRGFDLFNQSNGYKYKLVITSAFDEDTKKELQSLSKYIIFTGNITDEELAACYKNATVLLFASFLEGLGMPVLEAVQAGLPVVCSDIPVLSELSNKAFYMFNPIKASEIADCLSQATSGGEWNDKKKEYPAIIAKYTWDNSAKALLSTLKKPKLKKYKETLLVICSDPRGGSPAGRLLEYAYAGLTEEFNIKALFLKPVLQPSNPSYAFYAVTKIADRHDRYKLTLEINDATLLKRHSLAVRGVGVVLRKRSVFNFRARATKSIIELTYVKSKDKTGLNFRELQFYEANKILESHQLAKLFKKKLGAVTK